MLNVVLHTRAHTFHDPGKPEIASYSLEKGFGAKKLEMANFGYNTLTPLFYAPVY